MVPELRDPIKAKDVARPLTLKAASRLRRIEYYAGAMSFSARLENDMRVHAEERFYRAQDNNRLCRRASSCRPARPSRNSLAS
jgi:DNA polymerase IV